MDRASEFADRPARAERAFEGIAARIRGDVAAGLLKPGDKLPPERDLARQFQVGRNAVREALRDLEGKGILRLEQGRSGGAFVRPANASRVTHALVDMIDIGSIGVGDLTEARVLFMDLVVGLACERATEADFERLERNVDETEEFTRAGLIRERTDRLGQFYTLLAEATGNTVLAIVATSLSSIVRRILDQVPDSRRSMLMTTVPSRRRFMRHLRARDAERARRELDDHLVRLHRSLVDFAAGLERERRRQVKPAGKGRDSVAPRKAPAARGGSIERKSLAARKAPVTRKTPAPGSSPPASRTSSRKKSR